MGFITYRFQTNDKPWSGEFLAQEIEREWRRRLKPFRGELNLDEPGQTAGVYKARSVTIHHAVTEMTGEFRAGRTIFVANKSRKGVRCHAMEPQHPFGPIYPCTGPCKDDYPNMVIRHNAAGQLFKMQEPAALAYAEAERIYGRGIRITGEAWRSCSSQWALYRQDPGRFANPNYSRHCRGLAMDVYNDSTNLNSRSRAALISVGFSFPVDGEPWHCCFGPNPG